MTVYEKNGEIFSVLFFFYCIIYLRVLKYIKKFLGGGYEQNHKRQYFAERDNAIRR